MERDNQQPSGSSGPQNFSEREVRVAAGTLELRGILGEPATPRGIVLFAHGSGSGRFSPRNRNVARVSNGANGAPALTCPSFD